MFNLLEKNANRFVGVVIFVALVVLLYKLLENGDVSSAEVPVETPAVEAPALVEPANPTEEQAAE